jgi:Cu(I)/Ag(I) efflux system membrane fusion protein
VRLEIPDTLLVPRSAVLHTRKDPIVFVGKGGGAYEPRTVKIGRAGDDHYEVLAGVKVGERVVAEGALMLDGQAQLAHGSDSAMDGGETGEKPSDGRRNATGNSAASEGPKRFLEPLALAAADVSAALAADDLVGFQKVFPALIAALKNAGPDAGGLRQTGEKLVDGPDLKTARRAYEPFSTALADLARDAHLHHRGAVKIFQCPMTPVLGTGRWLQRDGELRNPFFGSAMPECGGAVE